MTALATGATAQEGEVRPSATPSPEAPAGSTSGAVPEEPARRPGSPDPDGGAARREVDDAHEALLRLVQDLLGTVSPLGGGGEARSAASTGAATAAPGGDGPMAGPVSRAVGGHLRAAEVPLDAALSQGRPPPPPRAKPFDPGASALAHTGLALLAPFIVLVVAAAGASLRLAAARIR